MESLTEARERLYDVVEMFFGGVSIIWTEQINTRPEPPYVTLKTGGIKKAVFPIIDDGKRFYQCETTVEINLYTRGKPQKVGEKTTGNYINTATSDLMDFVTFLESEPITDTLASDGLCVMTQGPVRDLTGLHDGGQYRYRAMAEFSVTFALPADGRYGVSGDRELPNPSGGGTAQMAETADEFIEDAEIIETIEKEVQELWR